MNIIETLSDWEIAVYETLSPQGRNYYWPRVRTAVSEKMERVPDLLKEKIRDLGRVN